MHVQIQCRTAGVPAARTVRSGVGSAGRWRRPHRGRRPRHGYARGGAASRAPRARRWPRSRDTARGPTPTRTECAAAVSAPTPPHRAESARRGPRPVGSGPPETRGRPSAPPDRSCGALRNSDKTRPLHENGTSRSKWQSAQRNRAKPAARQPHVRKSRNSCSGRSGKILMARGLDETWIRSGILHGDRCA